MLNSLVNRFASAAVLGAIYMLLSTTFEVFAENDLGFSFVNSSPLHWIGFIFVLLVIATPIFKTLGIQLTDFKFF